MSQPRIKKPNNFLLPDREKVDAPLHYTACGLDDVYLLNGFTRRETPYGSGVAIEDMEELHRAIGMSLVSKRGPLSPKELRFLRINLGLTQADMANRLDTDEQNLGRYERSETAIPGPVSKLAKAIYYIATCPEDEFQEFLEALQDLIEPQGEMDVVAHQQVFEINDREWHRRKTS